VQGAAVTALPPNRGLVVDCGCDAGFPQVVDVSTSKTGKHGHAKAKIVALNIFNGKKLEEVAPTSHNLFAPNGNAEVVVAWVFGRPLIAFPPCPSCTVTRKEYQLIDLSADGFASLMDVESGEAKDDLKLPPDSALEDADEMAKYNALIETFRAGEKDVNVTVLSAMGTQMILSQPAA
jgi:translation initiation factor 5A